MKEIETIKINEIEYVRKDSNNADCEKLDGMEYVIVRTYSAGVFAGYLKSRLGQEVVLLQARRLWQWSGAASLSQLSVDGTNAPSACKFPCEVSRIELIQAIEVIPCTKKAQSSIKAVVIWKA